MKERARKGIFCFCKEALGFEPTEYQLEYLKDEKQFIVIRWCRQSGKSHSSAGRLFYRAVLQDGSQYGIVGPSFRQSKLIVRKLNGFIQRNRLQNALIDKRVLKTKVALENGSVIEAYPCNPETIRGPTLDGILATEFNFVKDDEELYDAILFTLGTTNGWFVAESTPWSRDHIFYRICNEKEFEDFSRHHVTWKEAREPHGPLKQNILEKIRKQLAADPWRWQREMEAEWAEDDDVWLPQSLITSCIDPNMEIRVVDRQKSFWVTEPERASPT